MTNVFAQSFIISRLLKIVGEKDLPDNFWQEFVETDTQQQIIVSLKEDGFKKFMIDNVASSTISNLYSIFIHEFPDDFASLTTMKHNDNDDESNYYQCTLVNSQDMMPSIFQYLDLQSLSLSKCSMVHSIWLYHTMNHNSIFCADLDKINWTRYQNNFRAWSRISNIQSVKLTVLYQHTTGNHSDPKLNELSLLKNIKQIRIAWNVPPYKTLPKYPVLGIHRLHGSDNGLGLTHFRMDIGFVIARQRLFLHSRQNVKNRGMRQITNCLKHTVSVFKPLELSNCIVIKLACFGLHTVNISNKCKYLELQHRGGQRVLRESEQSAMDLSDKKKSTMEMQDESTAKETDLDDSVDKKAKDLKNRWIHLPPNINPTASNIDLSSVETLCLNCFAIDDNEKKTRYNNNLMDAHVNARCCDDMANWICSQLTSLKRFLIVVQLNVH